MPGIFRFKYAINAVNNGTLSGLKVMPQKDSTSDGTDNFAITRNEYVKTYPRPTMDVMSSIGLVKKWYGNSNNRDASSVTRDNQINEIGVGSLDAKQTAMSFTTYKDVNTVNDALRRVRAGGSVAPLKKNASKFHTITPGFPTGNLIRTDNRGVATIHNKMAMMGKPVSSPLVKPFH